MAWLHLASYFFGGVFLVNALPHTVCGVTGRAFQTPFATPRGEGLSSSTVNLLWGGFNLAVGYWLVCRVGAFDLKSTADVLGLALGGLAMGLFCARHFGRFHGGRHPGPG
jgi:hypothetical protein